MSYRKASEKYNIPITTLNDKVQGKAPIKKGRPGPDTYLTENQEKKLTEWLIHMSKIGFGVVRKDIPGVIKEILDEAEANGYVIPDDKKFPNNKPSQTWIYRFLKRYPEISARTPENLGFQRAYITERDIREWFEKLKNFMMNEHSINIAELLSEENGDRIWNLDETGFPLQGANRQL